MRRRHVLTLAAAGAVSAGCSAGDPPRRPAASPAPPARLMLPNGSSGAPTSAYQIEGAADEDGRGPSVWDVFSHQRAGHRGRRTGDVAADHYHRVRDLDLMRDLGLELPLLDRLAPGPADRRRHRQRQGPRLLRPARRRAARARASPRWRRCSTGTCRRRCEDEGGWVNRDTAYRFADYAEIVLDALGDRVADLDRRSTSRCARCTLGYADRHPRARAARRGRRHAGRAPPAARPRARRRRRCGPPARQGRIGPALNLSPAYPADDTAAADAEAARLVRRRGEPAARSTRCCCGRYPADLLADQAPDAPLRARSRTATWPSSAPRATCSA